MSKKLFIYGALLVGMMCSGVQAAHEELTPAIKSMVERVLAAAEGGRYKEALCMLPSLSAEGTLDTFISDLEAQEENSCAAALASYLRVMSSHWPTEALVDPDPYIARTVQGLKDNKLLFAQLLWAQGIMSGDGSIKGYTGSAKDDEHESGDSEMYTLAMSLLRANGINTYL